MTKKRHAGLADGLLAYKNRPEGDPVPVKTNWSVVPANDNNPEDIAGMRVNRRWATRPTMQEIKREIEVGEVVKNDAGQIIAIGSLRFSDGNQHEKAYCYGPEGKLIQFNARLPAGAMIGCKDAQERMLGGEGTQNGNSTYTRLYSARYAGKVKHKPRKDVEPCTLDKAELRELGEAAVASYKGEVTKCPKGFPWKPTTLREMFFSIEKTPKGETGSISWQDISGHIVEREIWAASIAALSAEDVSTLDAAVKARTLADLGDGGHKRTAERTGKRRLIAANDNLMAALEKNAA